jgi:ferredoxin
MAAARRQGYKWPTVCEMQATCTVCHLIVTSELHSLGPIEGRERDGLLSLLRRYPDRAPGEVRLACQAVVLGDVTVTKRGVTGPSPLARCEEQ